MRGIHESACIRTHPEIFGFRKVAIRKQFYIYGGKDQKYKRKPRKLNQNIPLLMDSSGFKAQNKAQLALPFFHFSIYILYPFLIYSVYIKTFYRFPLTFES